MLLSLLVAAALAATLSLPARADDDPIDAALDKCLSEPAGQTTNGMIQCLGTAYEAWDQALNEVYGKLRASLDPGAQAKLRDAQRAWMAFRDAESDFLGSLLTPESGSMMRVIANQRMTDTVKDRVLDLRSIAESADDWN